MADRDIPPDTPIVRGGIANDKNGSLQFHGTNINGEGWDHVFSFTFYYIGRRHNVFVRSKYVRGLTAYIEMVHRPEYIANHGVIIYTNPRTLDLLIRNFPQEKYPNIVYVTIQWPYFSPEKGELDRNIMRTMRYQAVDHFPYANVHIRDADTLFAELMETEMEDEEFNEIVLNWEVAYLNSMIPRIIESRKQIVLGSSNEYIRFWHSNIPYPVDFSFYLQGMREYYHGKYYINKTQNLDKHIFLRSKNETSKFPYTPYFEIFKEKYMYDPILGVYAGFASILKNREGIEDFWLNCVKYMISRYFIVNNNVGRKLSNEKIHQGTMAIGKDERMLLYAIIPNYLSKIFFIPIDYDSNEKVKKIKNDADAKSIIERDKDYIFFTPKYFDTIDMRINETKKDTLTGKFKNQADNYIRWLTEFKTKYPTQNAFLNSIDENLREAVPLNEVLKGREIERLSLKLSPYVKFEKAGRKATIRHAVGGTRKKLRSVKRKTKRAVHV